MLAAVAAAALVVGAIGATVSVGNDPPQEEGKARETVVDVQSSAQKATAPED